MKNIDFIYMINLDTRPEKYQQCLDQLDPFGISPYRFSAVDGRQLSFDTLNRIGIPYSGEFKSQGMATYFIEGDNNTPHHEIPNCYGRSYFEESMRLGPIGCAMSHLSVLKDAYESGYETIWVMEDDIQVIRNPNEISDLVDHIDQVLGKDGWDILFTDRETKDKNGRAVACYGYTLRPNYATVNPQALRFKKNISEKIRRIGARFGAYSMIIRRSGMKKILDFFNRYHLYTAYDVDYFQIPNIRFFTVLEDMVSTMPNAVSDNSRSNTVGQVSYPFTTDVELQRESKQFIGEISHYFNQARDRAWLCELNRIASRLLLISPLQSVHLGMNAQETLFSMILTARAHSLGKVILPLSFIDERQLESLSGMIASKDNEKEIMALLTADEELDFEGCVDYLHISANLKKESLNRVIPWIDRVIKGGLIVCETGIDGHEITTYISNNAVEITGNTQGKYFRSWVKRH